MNDVLVSLGRIGKCFRAVSRTRAFAAFALIAGLSMAASAHAVPYASSLTNNSGIISFRLNEPADSVRIISGAGATTNSLGALPAGLHSRAFGISGAFRVSVFKVGPVGIVTPLLPNHGTALRIGADSVLTRFNQPRGLAVNTDPASPYFGRVYVANGAAGAATNLLFGPPRNLEDGIYMLNPDLSDALGLGDSARTGGLDFDSGRGVSPYRLSLGQEGNLYISDWSDSTGSLYVTDPDVSDGSGLNVLSGPVGGSFPVTTSRFHGSISAAVVEGSITNNDLVAFVIDEDYQTDRTTTVRSMNNSLWRHFIGGTLPGQDALPIRVGNATPWFALASQIMDLSRGPGGLFYVNDYRSPGSDRGGVYVVDLDGNALWDSLAASREFLGDDSANDLLRAAGGGAVSPRGDYMAVINLESNGVTMLPLIDGIPDITNRLVFQGFNLSGPQGRDVAFDIAGNLYAISQGAEALRVFSPGGVTTAITGSDGTFDLVRPSGVSALATIGTMTEGGLDRAVITLTRTGDASRALVVSYTLSGTAINGTDFLTNALSATIPAGSVSVDITFSAIDDAISEPVESFTLTLTGSPFYDLEPPTAADVYITDNDPAVINIATIDSTAIERLSADKMVFRIDRVGETNSELFIFYKTSLGTATPEADYTGLDGRGLPPALFLAAGQTSTTLTLEPVDDSIYEGNETVAITIVPGIPGVDPYTPGIPNTAYATILDDEEPSAHVIFSDDMEADTSANWLVRFGANNGIFDAEVFWSFDYTTLGLPPAPNSAPGATRGLFVQVNKTNAAAGGSAGINLYPAGRTFSGNYALRFDMLVNLGPSSTTEHVLAGINHSGLLTNRVTQSTDLNNTTLGGDGVWSAIASDASNFRDYGTYTLTNAASLPTLITNRTASSLAAALPAPPYSFAGAPGLDPTATRTWAEVELGQINDIVTLKVNNVVVYSFPNTSAYKSGTIMIGLNDQFDSVGTGGTNGNFVVFDNIRVVSPDYAITKIVLLSGNKVRIDFTSPLAGAANGFRLQSTVNLSAPNWQDDNGAVITSTAEGYSFLTTRSAARFFRIRR